MEQSEAQVFLLSGERIIWKGRPKPGIWFEAADAFAIPFSIFWLAIVTGIFGMILTGQTTKVDPMAYVMMPIFFTVGLYFIFGRFLVARWVRSKTRYYLTNRRAIIRSGLRGQSERVVNLAATPETRISMARDGYGTIEFGQSSPFYKMMPRSWAFGQSSVLAPAFERIANQQDVYRLALQVQTNN
jgi:hypothetical protein